MARLFMKNMKAWQIIKKSAITSATPIHIASVSKVVTATAILKLVGAKNYI
jgi:CubicO group peptidase (beta-lactamase class C family)